MAPRQSDAYYQSTDWRNKRQARLEHDNHTCQGCGITATQLQELSWPVLQVHHKNAGPPDYRYPSFGNELLSDLLTLCSTCHDGITNSVRQQRYLLDPRKKIAPSFVQNSVAVTPPTNKQTLRNEPTPNYLDGRQPLDLPQRSNRRSSQFLCKSHEGGVRQAQKD